jgi:Tfp pilus assembly protein PilN
MSQNEKVSFLPEDYLDQKAQRRTNVICAALAGIVMAAIGAAFSLTEKVNRQAEMRHSQVERQYAEASKQIQQFQDLEKKERTMARQAELASSLLEKIPRSNILAEMTNAVPPGVSLTEFTLDSKRVISAKPGPQGTFDSAKAALTAANAPAEPIVYDVTITIGGTASNDVQVAEFIHRLSLSPLFKDVNLVISDELPADDLKLVKLRHFQVAMGLAADIDADSSGRPFNLNTSAELPGN